MEFQEFSNKLETVVKNLGINLTNNMVDKFYKYMNLLIEWNEKMNLTAIVEPNEVIVKHFLDCLTIEKYIGDNRKIIDVGTGAGFPGIPIGIVKQDCNIVLMDSLNKRINFLNEVRCETNLRNIDTVHARAEELSNNKNYREKFDIATSRAVASLNVLLEYMLPFVKVGGYVICMKGSNVEEEINNSKRALEILGGEIEKVDTFNLPNTDYGRNIVIIKKIKNTPSKYPRKAGTPSKEPLI